MNIPDFDAFELNELRRMAEKNEYYRKTARPFVLKFINMNEKQIGSLSKKQIGFLHAIKNDIKINLGDDGETYGEREVEFNYDD